MVVVAFIVVGITVPTEWNEVVVVGSTVNSLKDEIVEDEMVVDVTREVAMEASIENVVIISSVSDEMILEGSIFVSDI